MTVKYSNTSPYFKTDQSNGYLDVWTPIPFPFQTDDILYELEGKYQNRPDLLSYDLYNTVDLWWVFAVRNPSIIKDPVFDMVAGIKIYLPKITTLKQTLGF
jgi:hypothetical protein